MMNMVGASSARWIFLVLALMGCAEDGSQDDAPGEGRPPLAPPPPETGGLALRYTVEGLEGKDAMLHVEARASDCTSPLCAANHELPVSENGTFTANLGLETGQQYTVSVSRSPTDPVQRCHVQNGSGTVGTEDVTVLVTCVAGHVIHYTVEGLDGNDGELGLVLSHPEQGVEEYQEDIERHLAQLPVLARAPSFADRAGKFLRRHRAGVASAVTVVLLLIVIAALAVNQAVTSARQAFLVAEERDRAEQIQQFLVSLFAEADPNQAKGTVATAREILDRGATRIRVGLEGHSRSRADLSEAMAGIYSSMSLHDRAEELLEDALTLRVELGGWASAESARTLEALAHIAEIKGDYAGAEVLARQALDARRQIGDPAGTASEHALGQFVPAKHSYGRALEISDKLTPDGNADSAYMLNALAVLHRELGEHELAARRFREALDVLHRYFDSNHPNIGIISANLGMLLFDSEDFTAAEPLLRHALAVMESEVPDHPKLVQVRSAVARLDAR